MDHPHSWGGARQSILIEKMCITWGDGEGTVPWSLQLYPSVTSPSLPVLLKHTKDHKCDLSPWRRQWLQFEQAKLASRAPLVVLRAGLGRAALLQAISSPAQSLLTHPLAVASAAVARLVQEGQCWSTSSFP